MIGYAGLSPEHSSQSLQFSLWICTFEVLIAFIIWTLDSFLKSKNNGNRSVIGNKIPFGRVFLNNPKLIDYKQRKIYVDIFKIFLYIKKNESNY